MGFEARATHPCPIQIWVPPSILVTNDFSISMNGKFLFYFKFWHDFSAWMPYHIQLNRITNGTLYRHKTVPSNGGVLNFVVRWAIHNTVGQWQLIDVHEYNIKHHFSYFFYELQCYQRPYWNSNNHLKTIQQFPVLVNVVWEHWFTHQNSR